MEGFIPSLRARLSPSSKVLQDNTTSEFKSSLARWSDIDVRVPYAIVQAASEQDIVATVQGAVKAGIPFVPASGGHSPWSTIGQEGIVIDLSRYKGVSLHPETNEATVKGGTLMKEVEVALHPHERFAAVGNGNTVGVIPYYLGGGISIYTPLIGFGSDNLIAAKLVNAKGELVHVSETENPELLWALRGAGQFFGLVTEITIKTYPYSLLGNKGGQRICGTYVFLPHQIDQVCAAVETVIQNDRYASAGHFMVMQAPPELKQQVLFVAPQVFCSSEEAAKIFQPLVDVGTLQQAIVPSTFEKHSDQLDWVCAKGDFKRFTQNGLPDWNRENIKKLAQLHAELVENCPDAARSGYNIEWHSPRKPQGGPETAFGHGSVDYWLNVLSWYTDAKNHGYVDAMNKKAQGATRAGTDEADFVSYTNTSRDDPLGYRYKGTERIAKLRELKAKHDPTGVFTKQLL
ncbi:FAD binding domain-containing protein [Apiospora rasikravindrae]|uniref:FAD binding domain-containing protein n=1 Tax=Apiospora rasikravindrae TaxID=990691 RepID=A0ABR1U0V8_9PEZI